MSDRQQKRNRKAAKRRAKFFASAPAGYRLAGFDFGWRIGLAAERKDGCRNAIATTTPDFLYRSRFMAGVVDRLKSALDPWIEAA